MATLGPLDERGRRVLIVAMAGLPGTGKSTLARPLAAHLGAPLFDKDRVRHALFAPAHILYTREQDDLVCGLIHQAVRFGADRRAFSAVVLDGRTYSRATQIEELVALAEGIGARLEIVECVCTASTAQARLTRDAQSMEHPAADRGAILYERLAREREPIALPHLMLDTDRLTVADALAACLAHLGE